MSATVKTAQEIIDESANCILLYSKEECTLCDKTKELFETLGLPYKVISFTDMEKINKEEATKVKEELKAQTGAKYFPFCYINCEYQGGYKDLQNAVVMGKLQQIVNAIGLDYEEDF